MGHELRTKSMFFKGVWRIGIDMNTERDLFISLGDIVRQTPAFESPSRKSERLATPLSMSI
jgi:hypothetical protein